MRALLTTILIVITATSGSAAEEYLDKGKFPEAIVGKTITSKTSKGVPFTAVYKSNGTGDFQQKGRKAAKFKWTFKNDVVCLDLGDFQECNKVVLSGKSSAKFVDAKTGKLNNTYSIK
jgi:hypothetical protein